MTIEDEPWFVGKDVAEALGYSDTFGALKKHVPDDDRLVCQIDSAGQRRDVTVINESGLYALIFGSKLESAKRFKHWVTSEVLPSIRKHGAYMTEHTIEKALASPDFLIQLATKLKEEQERNKKLSEEAAAKEERIQQMKPKEIFADAVSSSKSSILIGDLAKILKQNGIDTGQKRLFAQLRKEGYLIKSGSSQNMPTQKAMERGLFEIKETTINNPDGSIRITKTTKVTGRGQQFFINKYLDRKGENRCGANKNHAGAGSSGTGDQSCAYPKQDAQRLHQEDERPADRQGISVCNRQIIPV